MSNATITYYPYTTDEDTGFSVYVGHPVEVGTEDLQPQSTSRWEPPEAPEGKKVYFIEGAWIVGLHPSTAEFEELRTRALTEATVAFERASDELNASYSASERSSWSNQLTDAQAYLSSSTSKASPLLTAMARARGIGEKEMAQKIVDKNTAHTEGFTKALADFHVARGKIEAAKNIEDLPKFTNLFSLC